MRATVAMHVEDGDEVQAHFHAAHDLPMSYGDPLRVPASIHVCIGGGLDLWGAPEVVLRTLCEALGRAREAEAAGTENVITDLGGAA
jgi:hypothetical protein